MRVLTNPITPTKVIQSSSGTYSMGHESIVEIRDMIFLSFLIKQFTGRCETRRDRVHTYGMTQSSITDVVRRLFSA